MEGVRVCRTIGYNKIPSLYLPRWRTGSMPSSLSGNTRFAQQAGGQQSRFIEIVHILRTHLAHGKEDEITCLSGETLKTVGPFHLVSKPGIDTR